MSKEQEISRRIQMDKMEPAEISIIGAMMAVEEMGADEKLTKAIDKLKEAKDLVADYIDGNNPIINSNKPKIVCLCGSTRFSEAFQQANLNETLEGNIVLSIGCDMKSDHDLFSDLSDAALSEIKEKLDELHKRKIDLADEVLILNVGGYIGSSTKSELDYALNKGKFVRFLESV